MPHPRDGSRFFPVANMLSSDMHARSQMTAVSRGGCTGTNVKHHLTTGEQFTAICQFVER